MLPHRMSQDVVFALTCENMSVYFPDQSERKGRSFKAESAELKV